jgi:hypothetical protein
MSRNRKRDKQTTNVSRSNNWFETYRPSAIRLAPKASMSIAHRFVAEVVISLACRLSPSSAPRLPFAFFHCLFLSAPDDEFCLHGVV